jgi:hypothetical protein
VVDGSHLQTMDCRIQSGLGATSIGKPPPTISGSEQQRA